MIGNPLESTLKEYKVKGLKYLNSRFNIFFNSDTEDLDFVLKFFGTHFLINDYKFDNVITDIYIHEEEYNNDSDNDGEEIWIRKSASEFFSIKAKRFYNNDKEVLEVLKYTTFIVLNRSSKRIDIYAMQKGWNLILIELIRNLVLKNEENNGCFILHSACIYREDKGVTLVTGSKGAGKTTLSLELVQEFNYLLMSGDKTILFIEDNRIYAAGWPDYPHLGIGTIQKYPEIMDIIGINIDKTDNLWGKKEKFDIDPREFYKIINTTKPHFVSEVERILYPETVNVDDVNIDTVNSDIVDLISNEESAFKENDWNNFIVDSRDFEKKSIVIKKLSGVKAYSIRSNGRLQEEVF